MKVTTQRLCISAVLLTADIVLTRVLALNTVLMKIGFGFAAVAVCAMLYGPVWTALVAALGDLLGSIIFPTGAYFPGFTLTAAMTGFVFGIFLYKNSKTIFRPLLAAIVNMTLISFLMNTAMISYISGTDYATLLSIRSVQLLVMIPVQAITLIFLSKSSFVQNAIAKYTE